mmetsp:Transcript_57344/g.117377  ORF Transcript_57344/g.117377 Transcript_57344/m.117377 type:complete len:162 (+) Transcript_57344:1-486(+)
MGATGLTCWKTTDPLRIDTPPTETDDCLDLLSVFEVEETKKRFLLSDQQAVANLVTCLVSCEGPTQESAMCSYGCTRRDACLMTEEMGKGLAFMESRNNDDTLFFEACVSTPDACVPHYYYQKCCALESNCNLYTGSSTRLQQRLLSTFGLSVLTLLSIAM